MLADQPVPVRLAQRLPPLVDLFGRGARRRHRNRPRLGRHLHPVVGLIHGGGEMLIHLRRLRQHLLERLRQDRRVMDVLREVESGCGLHRSGCRVDDQPEIAGGVKHLLQVVLDDLHVGGSRIGRPRGRQRRVGVLEQRLAGVLDRLLGFLGAGARPVGERRQAVGGVGGDRARVRAASPTVRTAPGSQRSTSSTVSDMTVYRLVGSSAAMARWLSASVSA